MQSEILWTPSTERVEKSALWQFAKTMQVMHGGDPADYDAVLRWSVKKPAEFYQALWQELDIIGERGGVIIAPGKTQRETKFFPQAELNYAENLLREPDDRMAIIAHRDDATRREMTRRQLYELVAKITIGLREFGVGEGDRIGAIVTNDIEAISCYLASAAVGAIWASCSPDFGPAGASDRLAQVTPKILITVPSYSYAGKFIDITATINAVAEEDSIEQIILLGDAPEGATYTKPATTLDDWIAPIDATEISFNRGPFDRPLAILFSSGTTGKPKCITHSAGGLLLQHKKEHRLQCDISEGDRLFYFTTCGWMMWNWQISALASGATLVTYDGNPFYPEPDRLVDLIDAEEITQFGTSAKYIDACAKAGVTPAKTHKLSQLRTILSTGSPLLPQSFDYIYTDWKADVHLASISGGTDICACFVGGVPILPVRRGEIQGAFLGMDLDALDEAGQSVTGEPGEFVCRAAHLSMPVCFWNDEDGSRYHDAYFTRFDNIWAQGDFIEKRPGGGFIIHGRSDTVLNPGGVRIGTAEIYRQVETIPSIAEAVVVGQNWEGDQRVILFVIMKGEAELDEELVTLIRKRIRAGATPRHVPAKIVAAPDIPRTRSGKISEIAVRDTLEGRAIKNTTALANADCLKFYRDWAAASTD